MTKRILFYTDSHSQCGVGISMAALLEESVRRGYATFCAQRREDTEYQRRLTSLGVTYHWFPRAPEEDMAAFINDHETPTGIFRDVRPDLIFFANGIPAGSYGAVQAARKLAIPYVISEGLLAENYFGGNDEERAALKRNYLAARAVIAKSRQNLDFLQHRLALPEDFGSVIHNSAADNFFAPPDAAARRLRRHIMGLAENDILCFTAANFGPIKRHGQQIQALRHLEGQPLFNHIKFAWAGGGAGRARLEQQIAEFGFDMHVYLLGHIPDVAEWLDAADIFILLSRIEGMPSSVIEAMAKGVPVIATPAGGTSEALGDCGTLLSDSADDEALARALADAISAWAGDPKARAEAGARGRARAQELFTRKRMLDAYMAVIGGIFASPT